MKSGLIIFFFVWEVKEMGMVPKKVGVVKAPDVAVVVCHLAV